ncbi:hypothetical protein AMST5_03913 [freshwater sediment metagenome]|uniref:Tc toxin complex TcA C-terminal TcB-binding domain-containing protein n=1 Tax=freshwater sediment metagenome TaxID=556182 RepID=A0AA48M637_9ZZZZ
MNPLRIPYIRDVVVIDQRFLDSLALLSGGETLFVLGRTIRLDVDLEVGAHPLVIVADEFDGNGHIVSARGAFPGGNGGSITLRCKRSVNAYVNVSGGSGAGGGAGADGIEGTPDTIIEGYWVTVPDPWPMETTHEEWVPGEVIPGTPGSPPGMGGAGGAGGNGGHIVFTSLTDEFTPSLEAGGGAGGAGGPGGFLGDVQAEWGADGRSGLAGSIAYSIVSEQEFLAVVRNDIGIYANYWAPFRIAVGHYCYHQYNPTVTERADKLQRAAVEFRAALDFQPDNVDALRLQKQLMGFDDASSGTETVWRDGGLNALGLPREMDLVPQFRDYIDAYNAIGSLVLQFLEMGETGLLAAAGYEAMQGFASTQLGEMVAARENSKGELGLQKSEQKFAGDEVTYARERLEKIQVEMQTAIATVVQDKPALGEQVFNTLFALGGAVASIAAAVPTGGASVVGLVPSLVALSNTLSDSAEPLVKSFLKNAKLTDEELKPVKEAYEKVGKNVESVTKGTKSIISFVKLVESLSAAAAAVPDRSKYVALVKQGAELAHDLMLAQNRAALAQQRVDLAAARLERAEACVRSVEQLKRDLDHKQHSVRQFATTAIAIAAAKASVLHTLAFRAQRSVEILTLQDHDQNVFLDAGMISPDDDWAYEEGVLDEVGLGRVLMASWGKMLSPASMQLAYLSYFDARPSWDTLRLPFKDSADLDAMRTAHCLTFSVDVAMLPPSHFETKIKNVLVALVGAGDRSSEISCMVRHGGRYEQRLKKDGSTAVQYLLPQVINRRAKKVALERPAENTTNTLDDATLMAFKGRGVGGEWEVAIEPHEIQSGSLDLSTLTEIQVWIDYYFIR